MKWLEILPIRFLYYAVESFFKKLYYLFPTNKSKLAVLKLFV